MKTIDVKNDIVLTPDYVADLMCKLACVDNTSIVADNAAGAGALLSAAHRNGASDIVGVELSDMMFPILEQTLKETDIACDKLKLKLKLVHGDGLSDDLDFSNVTVALSNPPYSMPGKGLCFALNVMKQMKKGRVVVLIQDTAGAGQGDGYGAEMLHYGRLLYSIKMPDIFKGFASVQTSIYVFEVGRQHSENDVVKFVDFTNDGYTRSGRKSQKGTVKDTDNAKERYDELLNVLLNDAEPEYFKDDYIEEKITLSGDDWNYSSHKKIDTTPTLDDFLSTVRNYMEWKSSQNIQKLIGKSVKGDPNSMICTRYLLALGIDPRKNVETICKKNDMQKSINNVVWKDFKWCDLFERVDDTKPVHGMIVKVTDTIILKPKDESTWKEKAAQFFVNEFKKLHTDDWEKAKNMTVRCPCKVVEEIDWAYMREFIEKIEAELIDGMDIETILSKVIIKMP